MHTHTTLHIRSRRLECIRILKWNEMGHKSCSSNSRSLKPNWPESRSIVLSPYDLPRNVGADWFSLTPIFPVSRRKCMYICRECTRLHFLFWVRGKKFLWLHITARAINSTSNPFFNFSLFRLAISFISNLLDARIPIDLGKNENALKYLRMNASLTDSLLSIEARARSKAYKGIQSHFTYFLSSPRFESDKFHSTMKIVYFAKKSGCT